MVRFNLLGELRLEIDGRDVELPASRKASRNPRPASVSGKPV